jgi:excinuclease ABC subunit C
MLSYLAPAGTSADRRMRHLSFAIRNFRFRETGADLLALLLEDALIKQLQPRHNVRQREDRERRYLLLTGDAFAACLVVEGPGSRAGTLFGPFKDQYFVERLIALLVDEFGLRACRDVEPFRRSARYDLGLCPGPCRGAITAGDYAMRTALAREFLEGDEAWLVARLNASIERLSESLEYERAAATLERRAFAERFAARQRFFRCWRDRIVVEEASSQYTYTFEGGRLAHLRAGAASLAIPAELTIVQSETALLDRAMIVYNACGQDRARVAP